MNSLPKGEHKNGNRVILIGVGLSMDAFAVSVCKGLGMEKSTKTRILIGLYFGGFQALMPFLGWALGIRFQKYITSVDHWIAFSCCCLSVARW